MRLSRGVVRRFVEDTPAFYGKVGGELELYSYRFIDYDVYRESGMAEEVRGIIFSRDTGEVVARPLPRIHTFGGPISPVERHEEVYVLEKLDGSMVTAYTFGGEPRFSSKGALRSWVSERAEAAAGRGHLELVEDVSGEGGTAVFELLDPENPVVITPRRLELRLLAIRDNETGEFLPPPELVETAESYGVNSVQIVREGVTAREAVDCVSGRRGIEGVVGFGVDSGNLFKAKTEWYLDRHEILSDIEEREDRVKRLALRDELHDLYSLLEGDRREYVERLEAEAKELLKEKAREVEEFMAQEFDSRKDLALTLKDRGLLESEGEIYFNVWDGDAPLEAARRHLLRRL